MSAAGSRAWEGVCRAPAVGAESTLLAARAGRLSAGAAASRYGRTAAADLPRPFRGRAEHSSPCLSLGLELQTQQSRPQDSSCLPALKVSDIEPSVPLTELEVALAGRSTEEGATGGRVP